MKFKFITLIALFLFCLSFNASAQKWSEPIDIQRNKIDSLQTKVLMSNKKLLMTNNYTDEKRNISDAQNLLFENLQFLLSTIENVTTNQLLFEMITSKPQVLNAQKLLKLRQTQLISEMTIRAESLQRQIQVSKDNETTKYMFETRDLFKSTQELISTNFKY
jgi:hypothetical protein